MKNKKIEAQVFVQRSSQLAGLKSQTTKVQIEVAAHGVITD